MPLLFQMKRWYGKLDRNYLTVVLGDKINALLCGAGHNIHIILRRLREMFPFFCVFTIVEENCPPISMEPMSGYMLLTG